MNDVTWLLRFARPASAALAGSIAARILGHVLAAAVLAVPAWAIGRAAAPGSLGAAAVWAVLEVVVVMALVKALSRYAEQFLGHYAAFRLMGEMRVWVIDRVIPQAPAVTDGEGAAKLHATAVRDVGRVEVFFAHTIAPAVTAVVIPVAATVAAWVLAGPAPAIAYAAVTLAGVATSLASARSGRAAARDVVSLRGDIAAHVADTVRLREDILSNQATGIRMRELADLDRSLGRRLAESGRRAGVRHGAGVARVWLGTIVVLLAAIPAAVADASALPGVLAAASLVAGTTASLDTVERLAGSLPAGLEATRRIRELTDAGPAVREPGSAEPGSIDAITSGSAALDHVTFAYPDSGTPAIRDAVAVVKPGEFIGIAGATGSGKSTVARLLQRHWDPDDGRVVIGGADARRAGSEQVFAHVAVADQAPFLVDAGVADNLRLADPDADDELIARALHVADFDDAPADGTIGRRGERLSGGQRQRLAVARTFLRAARAPGGPGNAVMVLDEATSHQDPLTQRRIIERLRGAGVTLVVIAHRLATLRDADSILVVAGGRIVERGTYDELAGAGGHFAALLDAQE